MLRSLVAFRTGDWNFGNSEHYDLHQTATLPPLHTLVVLVVLQARGDEGHVQAARWADRLVLLRLGARSELARVAAPFSEGEQDSANAAERTRKGASREDN